MKTLTLVPAMLAATLVSQPALASLQLAQQNACMACHAVDRKLVGPSYQDVAKKYAGQKDAEAKLAEKVIKGGKGAWGPVPMPPNAVKPDEAAKLVKWILSLK